MFTRRGSPVGRTVMPAVLLSLLVAATASPPAAAAAAQVTPIVDATNGQLVAFTRASGGDVVEFPAARAAGNGSPTT